MKTRFEKAKGEWIKKYSQELSVREGIIENALENYLEKHSDALEDIACFAGEECLIVEYVGKRCGEKGFTPFKEIYPF